MVGKRGGFACCRVPTGSKIPSSAHTASVDRATAVGGLPRHHQQRSFSTARSGEVGMGPDWSTAGVAGPIPSASATIRAHHHPPRIAEGSSDGTNEMMATPLIPRWTDDPDSSRPQQLPGGPFTTDQRLAVPLRIPADHIDQTAEQRSTMGSADFGVTRRRGRQMSACRRGLIGGIHWGARNGIPWAGSAGGVHLGGCAHQTAGQGRCC